MNIQNSHEDDLLARVLHGRVDGMSQAPLSFDDIAAKAHTIRRRRRVVAAGAVAAAVAAIAIPAAVLSGGGGTSRSEPPVVDNPLRPVPGVLELSTAGLPIGDAPRVAWVDGGTIHLPASGTVPVPGVLDGLTVSSLALLGDHLVLGSRDDEGNAAVTVTTRGGDVVTQDQASGDPTLSADGTIAAYVRPDGTPVLLTGGDPVGQELPRVPVETPLMVAVSGSAPCERTCTVWVNDGGRTATAWRVDSAGATRITTTGRVNAVRGDRYIGILGLREDLFPIDGVFTGGASEPDWQAEALKAFSPDGLWVIRQFSEGLGASELAVLDAETGEPQVQWQRTAAEGATALGDPVWEDETHLVQLLTQGREVVIARFGLDGTFELTGVSQQVDDPTLSTLFLAAG